MNPINTDKNTAASATNISAGDPGYGNDTRMTMNRITSESVRIIQDHNSYVIISAEDSTWQIVNPTGRDRAEDLLASGRGAGESGKDYARRLGISPQELSMFKAHASNFRVPGRDVVLKVILGTCPIPDEQAVEHILMELLHPGLFTSTYSLPENRRNEALRCIFAWLREHECGDSILFASFVLRELGLADLHVKNADYSVFDSWKETAQADAFLSECRNRISLVSYCDFSNKRADFRAAFIKREGLEDKALPYIYDQLYYKGDQTCSVNVIQDFFGRMTRPRSRSARDTIIEMGIKMGCSLEDINLMLLEANYALLYPRSFFPFDVIALSRIRPDEN